jgi:hypothetical protein
MPTISSAMSRRILTRGRNIAFLVLFAVFVACWLAACIYIFSNW